MKNLLSIESLAVADMKAILAACPAMKASRRTGSDLKPLAGQIWAMVFSKSSTRTRVSFEVGIRELGGSPVFLSASDIQLGRGEPIKDTARVLGRMVHGAVFRTHSQQDVEEFAAFSGIPTINALTDEEHPCQILADIFTFEEKRGSIAGRKVAFFGDGASNVAVSWMFAAPKLGFEFSIAAPLPYQPPAELVRRAGGRINVTTNRAEAATHADLLYTDVWISMGKETESDDRLRQMNGYQVNGDLVKLARPEALVMHCLPAYRGKEIDEATFEKNADTIFDEAENRLHAQKAVLEWIVRGSR